MILSSPFLSAEEINHDSYLSYLPKTGYVDVSFNHLDKIRSAGVTELYPEFVDNRTQDICPVEKGQVSFFYSFQRNSLQWVNENKMSQEEIMEYIKAGKSARPMGFSLYGYVVIVPNLQLWVEEHLKAGDLQPTGQVFHELPLFQLSFEVKGQRMNGYACIPEGDMLLFSGSQPFLKEMVLSGLGLKPSLVDSEFYIADIKQYLVEGHSWSFSHRGISLLELGDVRAAERIEKISAISYIRFYKYTYTDDEIIQNRLLAFNTAEKAKQFYDSNNRANQRYATDIKVSERLPAWLKNTTQKNIQRVEHELDENRLYSRYVMSSEYIEEHMRNRREHKEYYDKVEQDRKARLAQIAGEEEREAGKKDKK